MAGDSGGQNKERNEPEMRALLRENEAGRLQPVEVPRGPLPENPLPFEILLADEMTRRMGLRAAVGMFKPLPFALREAVRAGICVHPQQASRALQRFVDAGTFEYIGAMPPRGQPHGTKLYAPPGSLARARGKAADVVIEPSSARPEVEPPVEVVDDSGVDAAQAGGGIDLGMVAASAPAFHGRDGRGHGADPTPNPDRKHPPESARIVTAGTARGDDPEAFPETGDEADKDTSGTPELDYAWDRP